ncbi:DDRGK domain-containing protein 1 [Trichinella pseudospiralis]|uniref:DDRGK domain-containing protein 1 n=1 Tax=Trichinella pseudospiralis TaxID=6337 RepID=A0A0V0YGQ5_TRIPS|nr:DDRGK domain-containing protein 1 [Trichinella pseudospiralis]
MNQSDMTQHNENWMRDLPLFLKMKPLTHLFIPGSHQSFSDLLNKKLPIAIDVPKVLRFVDSPWTRRTIERWGRCQELNVTDQLRLGIRYFDVRVAFLPGECEQSLDIFLLHGLYGRPIKEVLNEMYTFIIDHPEEILILDINHFYNFNDELHRKFLGQLEHLFNELRITDSLDKLITMDPMLICSVLILLVFMAIGCIQIYKLFLKENRNIRRVNLNELAAQRNNNRQQQQAARALVGGRHAGGVRRRNVAAAGDASGSDSGGEESEIKLPGKVGKKKLAKLRAKEERKQAREAEEEERAIKRQLEEERAEKRRKREEEEEEKERQKELEEKRRLEEEKRKEQEEYEKLKKGFTVEEQGCDVDISEDTTNLLKEFVEYIQKVKVVSMEELAGQFHMRTTDVIDRLKNLLADGMLTGVIDDRGKFIFVTEDEMKAIVTFVKQRGRVSVDDLVDYSNKLINMDPQHVTLQCS